MHEQDHTHDEGQHSHHDHEHGHREHEQDPNGHEHADDPAPDVSGWIASAQTASCPACGAPGALTLGGGLFCPTCGAVTTNPGYEASPAPAASDPD